MPVMPRRVLRWARRCRGLRQRVSEWPEQRRELGRLAALQLGWSAFRYPVGDPRDSPGPLSRLPIEGLPHPFWYRQGTSDVSVVRQIFVHREYDWLAQLPGVRTIVDLGANIGGASVRFLNLFPSATITAVEPMPETAALLERNAEPYCGRVKIVRGAVWSSDVPLELVRGQFRDGLDWSAQVLPARGPSGNAIRGITMNQLLSTLDVACVDLVKIDIEGAERELFAGDSTWLKRVRNFCIEIHDQDCHESMMKALRPFRYEMETRQETTLVRDLVPR